MIRIRVITGGNRGADVEIEQVYWYVYPCCVFKAKRISCMLFNVKVSTTCQGCAIGVVYPAGGCRCGIQAVYAAAWAYMAS